MTDQGIAARNIALAMWNAGIAEDRNNPLAHKDFTENAITVLKRRYVIKDHNGEAIEAPNQVFRRVAHNLAKADLNYPSPGSKAPHNRPTEEDIAFTEEEFFDVMDRQLLIPNSPTLMNAGARLQQLAACFVLPVDDSLDDIFQRVKETALIHKSGGGTGFSFSRLRPKNDIVGSTGGIASGPVGFIRAFDTTTDVVKQGGTRRGANMAVLRVDHPDIMDFIHCKDSGNALENFNISVAVTDAFMSALHTDSEYDLVNPRTTQVAGRMKASTVWEQIVNSAHLTGDPGLIFLDTINAHNPNPHLGPIEAVNPCGEQMLMGNEACTLGSINLARMLTYPDQTMAQVNYELLKDTCRTAVHMLDNVLDMNNYPTPDIERVTKSTRRIGIGVMGTADMLVQLGLPYDSQEARNTASDVMAAINQYVREASRDLATVRGPYPEMPKTDNADIIPIRNTAPTTIAPTGTISIIAGASSGIEPLFALAYTRTVMDQTKLQEANPYFEAAARAHGFHSQELMDHVARTGSVQNANVPQWVKDIFKTSQDISPRDHVLMQAAFQEHVANGVSKTINFPSTATTGDIQEAYLLAHQKGCKGITVYRDGSKAGQVLSTGQTPSGPNGHQPPALNGRTQAKPRPRIMTGRTERIRTGHGNMYMTVNFDETGEPFESFSQVGRSGGCDSAQLEAISRLISLALRTNIDPDEIITNLRGITCCPMWDDGNLVKSIPDALAQGLNKCIHPDAEGQPIAIELPMQLQTRLETTKNLCPQCASPTAFLEGCEACTSPYCAWNKCE